MARPRFPRWNDLHAPRHPPTPAEGREFHAVRLALLLSAGVLYGGIYTPAYRPVGDDEYDQLDWLRDALAPLAAVSPTVRRFRRLLQVEAPHTRWFDPAQLRRQLHALRREAARLAAAMERTTATRRRRARRSA